MYILRGLRYPTALAFGLLFTGAIFWSLWSFTNVTFEIPAVKTIDLSFSRTIVDRPPQPKTVDQPIEKPVIDVVPPIGGIAGEKITPVTGIERTLVERPDIKGPVLAPAQDRDVIPLVRINPEYPQRALRAGTEGWVQVQFTITGTGSVTDVVVVESSPPRIFDEAAVSAVSRWRYNPKVEGAVAVERVGVQTILRFDLEEE